MERVQQTPLPLLPIASGAGGGGGDFNSSMLKDLNETYQKQLQFLGLGCFDVDLCSREMSLPELKASTFWDWAVLMLTSALGR